ncbi:hypothetical protein DFH09DRAFT_1089179 [Mycena vulgaris]|nr:hypothetical protein DFH09DRAFT_1089179 [Mycena vulgaris]
MRVGPTGIAAVHAQRALTAPDHPVAQRQNGGGPTPADRIARRDSGGGIERRATTMPTRNVYPRRAGMKKENGWGKKKRGSPGAETKRGIGLPDSRQGFRCGSGFRLYNSEARSRRDWGKGVKRWLRRVQSGRRAKKRAFPRGSASGCRGEAWAKPEARCHNGHTSHVTSDHRCTERRLALLSADSADPFVPHAREWLVAESATDTGQDLSFDVGNRSSDGFLSCLNIDFWELSGLGKSSVDAKNLQATATQRRIALELESLNDAFLSPHGPEFWHATSSNRPGEFTSADEDLGLFHEDGSRGLLLLIAVWLRWMLYGFRRLYSFTF